MDAETCSVKEDKHLLIAVDNSDSARRAVLYVADFLRGCPGYRATLLTIIPEPERDFFDTDEEMNTWIRNKVEEANKTFEDYRSILIKAGFPEDAVNYRACVGESRSLSEALIETHCERCTMVVGRSHKSKDQEFLFGSTSNRLIHGAKNRAVWVVE